MVIYENAETNALKQSTTLVTTYNLITILTTPIPATTYILKLFFFQITHDVIILPLVM